jgi:hypothetical protein
MKRICKRRNAFFAFVMVPAFAASSAVGQVGQVCEPLQNTGGPTLETVSAICDSQGQCACPEGYVLVSDDEPATIVLPEVPVEASDD